MTISDSSTPNPEVTSDDKLWAMLAYLFTPIIPLIILLMEDKKNRPFIKAHNVQALALGIVIAVLAFLIGLIPVVNCIVPFVWLAIVIMYAIKAYRGEYFSIPLITDFVKNQGWA